MEKLVFKNSYNLFLLKPSSKISTQKFSLKVYKKLLKVKFFCIFLPSNQKLVLKYCIFIEIDSNFSNFIPIQFNKFFETGKFEAKSHIVHWTFVSCRTRRSETRHFNSWQSLIRWSFACRFLNSILY